MSPLACQRPVLAPLRQSRRPHEVGEIVGEGVKRPDGGAATDASWVRPGGFESTTNMRAGATKNPVEAAWLVKILPVPLAPIPPLRRGGCRIPRPGRRSGR